MLIFCPPMRDIVNGVSFVRCFFVFSLSLSSVEEIEMAADEVIESCDYYFHFIQSCL